MNQTLNELLKASSAPPRHSHRAKLLASERLRLLAGIYGYHIKHLSPVTAAAIAVTYRQHMKAGGADTDEGRLLQQNHDDYVEISELLAIIAD